MRRLARSLGACVLAMLLASGMAWSTVAVPPLTGRVVDQTGTLSTQEMGALSAKLAALEQATGAQLAVLIIPSTEGEPIEALSLRVAEGWKLGQKDKNNGILYLVAKNDRKQRLEVGYGLEGTLPDAIAKRLIQDTAAPYFRKQDFAGGIHALVDQTSKILGGDPSALPQPAQASSTSSDDGDLGVLGFLGMMSLAMLGILGRFLGSLAVGGIMTYVAMSFLGWGFVPAAGLGAVLALVLMVVNVAGWLRSSGHGAASGGFVSSSSSSSSSSWSSSDSFSGGGGDFGGGGASGDW